ncbi:MAG: hypothetical protein IPQ01_11245 [Zoogloea sp.]|nr:hypothetical protein [Zoogloea sp.]
MTKWNFWREDHPSREFFSSVYPEHVRQPAHPDTDPTLRENGPTGLRLETCAKTTRGKQALRANKEMMKWSCPQLEDISTKQSGFIHPRFKVKEKRQKPLFDLRRF